MPLQFSEFTDLPLLFIILEPCHYNFTNLRTIPLHTLSLCFLNFMDKNTPDLLLPPLISLSFLSISAGGRRARAAPPAARRLGHCGLPAGGKHPRPLEAAAAPPAARRPGGPCRRGGGHGGRGTTLAGRRARGEATGPWDGTLHRRRPPSRLPTFLPGAPARWPRGADGGLARARARRAAAGGRAQQRRPGSLWPANRGAEPCGGRDSAASLRPLPLSPPRRPPVAARQDPPRAGGGPRGGAGAPPPPPRSSLHRRPSSPSPLVVGMAAGELGVATPRRPANARRRPVARAADAPRWGSAEEFVAVGICLRERGKREG